MRYGFFAVELCVLLVSAAFPATKKPRPHPLDINFGQFDAVTGGAGDWSGYCGQNLADAEVVRGVQGRR